MELDDFKAVLKTKLEEQAPSRSARDLEQSIHRKTVSLLDKIKRSITGELAANLLVILLCIRVWWHYPSFSPRCFSIFCGIFCFYFMLRLAALRKKILFFEKAQLTVKERLQQIIDILERFTRFYFRFSMGLLPVAFVLGLTTGYIDILHEPLIVKNFHWITGIITYMGLFIAWSVFTWAFCRWYIQKLYGNYLAGIRNQLEDLEND